MLILKRKEFSNKVSLKDERTKSSRGYGRAIVLGQGAGYLGTRSGKKKAEELDNEGASDTEIINESGKRGALVGGLSGLGLGAIDGAAVVGRLSKENGFFDPLYLLPAGYMTVGRGILGAIGGALGARKNARERLSKKSKIERSEKKKD